MSSRSDARAECALLDALADGPRDVLGLIDVLRRQAAWLLRGGEGVVHPLLHRLVRAGRIEVGPPGMSRLATYRVPGARSGDDAADDGDGAVPEQGDLPPIDRKAAEGARRVARGIADPAHRGRVQADIGAHWNDLIRRDRMSSFGRPGAWQALLQRIDRGRRTVAVVAAPGDLFRRLLVHDGLWLLGIVGAFLLARAFVVEVFHIPSSSMEPTLQIGDRVVVRKFGAKPTRWDLVTFELGKVTYVKRMVGMPGETFGIRNGDLYADGELLVKPDDLTAALRRPVARWDFAAGEGARGAPREWRRVAEGDLVTWTREAPPFRPNGSHLGESGPYGFAMRDGWLVVHATLGGAGTLIATVARSPFGYEAEDPAARLDAEVGRTGTRLWLRRRDDTGTWRDPEVLLEDVRWGATGEVALELGVIDGEVRLAHGGRSWRRPISLPDEPFGISVGTRGPDVRLGAVGLDADQHWSHDHQLAVPGYPAGGRVLPPLSAYAYRIPDDAFFALGDNTLNSDDSRTLQKGAIPLDAITGPVIFRVWPPSRLGVPD